MSELELRKKAAMKELAEIFKWDIAESRKVFKRRVAEGKYLDHNKEDYSYIYEEVYKRIKELREKYNLPSDTKINFKEQRNDKQR